MSRFHRSDFTGSEGPGLAKLREAKAREGWADQPRAMLEKKAAGAEIIKEMMRRGLWEKAIIAAARFPEAPEAIQRGREAILRPAFMRQLKRDPEAAIEAAKAALLERWPL